MRVKVMKDYPMIEYVRIRNFKSFKNATIKFKPGYTAITGPNGSGKSNIFDAICFTLGIGTLKMLRAGRLLHLVRRGADKAEVEVSINHSGRVLRIYRRINPKGGSVYKLNGRRVSLRELEVELSKIGIRKYGYNIVSQGDVTLIIEMTPRERRQILNEISGVAEFEEREKEIMSELLRVDEKLREAEAILRERERRLEELKTQVERLREYVEAEKMLKAAEAAIMRNQIAELEERIRSIKVEEPGFDESALRSVEEKLARAESRVRMLESDPLLRKAFEVSALAIEIEKKRRNLSKLLEKIEVYGGYSRLPKKVVESDGYIGVVGDILKPKSGYETPYTASLWGRLRDIVVSTYEQAVKLANTLSSSGKRWRIIPLDVLKENRRGNPPGWSLGHMADYVEYDERFKPLVDLLLGGTVLVKRIEDVPRSRVGTWRFVSMDGVVLERSGILICGKVRREALDRSEYAKLIAKVEELKLEIKELEGKVEGYDPDAAKAIQDELSRMKMMVQQLRDRRDRLLRLKLEVTERRRRAASEMGMLKARIESLKERLAQLGNVPNIDPSEAFGLAERMRLKLRLLSPVNHRAEEEYREALKEYNKINSRVQLVKEERNKVMEALEEVRREKKRVLQETLERLSGEFNRTFKDLTGGEGVLEVDDIEDPESGLEIKVNLPGKKMATIDQLSGGEKSISALAFIVAIQKLRPAPFYLFDEADLMLDPRNAKKYAEMLKRIGRECQVIAISLKRETVEPADHIIGVTMRNGVSKIVAVDMAEET